MKNYDFSTSNNPAPWGPELKKIVIGEGVTYIGSYAFEHCEAPEISIANTVTEIGEGAFARYGKGGIEYSIELPESVECIGPSVFKATQFKTITIPSPVSIGGAAFEGSPELKAIDLTYSDGAVVANSTFYDCQGLESVILRGNISEIGPRAFDACYALTTIEIPDATPNIADCPVDQSPFKNFLTALRK